MKLYINDEDNPKRPVLRIVDDNNRWSEQQIYLDEPIYGYELVELLQKLFPSE